MCAARVRAAVELFGWLDMCSVRPFTAVERVLVTAYIEELTRKRRGSTATLRQVALRHRFNRMISGQIMSVNPAAAVRGQRDIALRGRMPILSPVEVRDRIDAVDTSVTTSLRDHALKGSTVCSFARIGAMVGDTRRERPSAAPTTMGRLHERGARQRAMPDRHKPESHLLGCRARGRRAPPKNALVPALRSFYGAGQRQSAAPAKRLQLGQPSLPQRTVCLLSHLAIP